MAILLAWKFEPVGNHPSQGQALWSAAGEVIGRLVSVLKQLLNNTVDTTWRRVVMEVEESGAVGLLRWAARIRLCWNSARNQAGRSGREPIAAGHSFGCSRGLHSTCKYNLFGRNDFEFLGEMG
jgi:hypothetical protein